MRALLMTAVVVLGTMAIANRVPMIKKIINPA
jgi:hypothetical protein